MDGLWNLCGCCCFWVSFFQNRKIEAENFSGKLVGAQNKMSKYVSDTYRFIILLNDFATKKKVRREAGKHHLLQNFHVKHFNYSPTQNTNTLGCCVESERKWCWCVKSDCGSLDLCSAQTSGNNKETYESAFFLPRTQTRRQHVRRADGLDLFYAAELRLQQQLVKVTDDFVEQSKTLQPLLVNIRFIVELFVVGNRCKQHADGRVAFVIKVLRHSLLLQKMLRNVSWQNVLKQNLRRRKFE